MMIDYEKELNAEQLKAVQHIDGPLQIIAGAGTGKTRTMVYRAAYMIESGVAPSSIIMLTFTNKAANEMKERLQCLLPGGETNRVVACTFHSFCVLMLRIYGQYINLTDSFVVLAAGEDEDIISLIRSSKKARVFTERGFPRSNIIANIISSSVNKNRSIKKILEENKFSQYAEYLSEIEEIARDAQAYKLENMMLNYDDLLVYMNKLLQDVPEVAEIIARHYPYIMVDEYQDTNPLQESILKHLFRYTKNIAVVGDDLQSLYAFRGADVDNIIYFSDRFEGCTTQHLVRNYRSNQEILDLSNAIVQHATEGFKKTLIGCHSVDYLPIVHEVHDQQMEAEDATQLILHHHETGTKYKDICVLARNAALSAGLEAALNREKIPFVKYGGLKFFDRACVKDIFAYLRLMINPHDELSWFRVLKIHYGIGDKNAKTISSGCRKNGVKHLLSAKYKKRIYAAELKVLHNEFKKNQDLALVELITSFIEFYYEINKQNIEKMKTSNEDARSQLLENNQKNHKDLQVLIDLAHGYNSISAFLDDMVIDPTKNAAGDEGSDDALVISTIHSAKGLEFDVVLILDCIDEIFPSTRKIDEGSPADNEELRCFYVACTRAKKHLHLYYPTNAFRFGRPLRGRLSHFLEGAKFKTLRY